MHTFFFSLVKALREQIKIYARFEIFKSWSSAFLHLEA